VTDAGPAYNLIRLGALGAFSCDLDLS